MRRPLATRVRQGLFIPCAMAGLLAGLLLGSSGCSFHASVGGSDTVKKDDVVNAITKAMTDSSGKKPDSVSCPDELKFEVGATATCQIKVGDEPYKVVVTVNKIDGDQANFTMVRAVPKDEVVKTVSNQMTDAEGNKPESVTCPGDLDVKAGATLTCQMQIKGKPFEVVVTITSVDPVNYEMVETVDKNDVAGVVSDRLAEQVGRKPDSVTCPENLQGKVGATVRCELVGDGEKYGVTVTVTSVEGGTVNFDFKVDDTPQ
ncbi:MAG: hypothetical protein QOH57_2604 [Mycobacterium sp.]|nr:hypothetical protein [Mycobacterium sp.]